MSDRIQPVHVAVACGVALACASPASAFDYPIHVEITKAGLAAVVDSFVRSLTGQPTARGDLSKAAGTQVTTFTPKAIQEITDANRAQDTDDCGTKDNLSIPAKPCDVGPNGRGSALWHLTQEPTYEHFDGEDIVGASNFVFTAREDVIRLMKQGNFIGARKRLGQALHALQDFYSHTNYVEMKVATTDRPAPFTEIDRRIGWYKDSFLAPGTRPRLARPDEPTCLQGEYLFTNDLKTKLMEELKNTSPTDYAQRTRILESLNYLTRMLQNPDNLALTSGFFRFTQTFGDPEVINGPGKCRHGLEVIAGQPLSGQPGINKDNPTRPHHFEARGFATIHTTQFIVDIMGAILSDPDVRSEDKYPCIVGLLGYEKTTMMTRVTVGIPGAPNGESWDTAIGSALGFFVRGTQGLKNIQPDILICMESATVPGVCLPLCDDAAWSLDLNAYVCSQPVSINGWGTRVEPDLRVLLREVDLGDPKRVIANFRVGDPRGCDPFCSYDLEPPGSTTPRPVWIRFEMKPVTQYGGPTRPRRILPPADAIPEAKPASATAGQTGSTTTPSSSTSAPSPSPGVPVASAFSSSTGTASLSTTTAAAASAAPLRSPEGIDSRLALRDADNCTGADAFYTGTAPASLTGAQSAQLYQMAAFSMAVTDATAKQAVLNAIRAKVGDDAFFTAMTAVIADPVQSQTLVTAYQNTTRNVAQKISSTGLASLLPTPIPPSAMQANVDRWVLARLSSPALVSSAINLMSGVRPLTAECTVNELAKQGFTATVLP